MEVHRFGSGAPHICFTAGIHGDEVTAIYTARKLIAYLTENPPLRGSVTILPTVNLPAMRIMRRRNPFDDLDLNRVFPGDAEGSFACRLADAVWKIVADADYLIDLHCCEHHKLPYILSVYPESEQIRDLVRRITLPTAVLSAGDGGQLFLEAFRRRGQVTCLIELTSGDSYGAINLPVAEQGFAALLDLLRSEGIAAGEVQGTAPKFYGKLKNIPAPAGLWMPVVQNGQTVRQGDTVGEVDGKPVIAPADGMIMRVTPCSYLMGTDPRAVVYLQPNE